MHKRKIYMSILTIIGLVLMTSGIVTVQRSFSLPSTIETNYDIETTNIDTSNLSILYNNKNNYSFKVPVNKSSKAIITIKNNSNISINLNDIISDSLNKIIVYNNDNNIYYASDYLDVNIDTPSKTINSNSEVTYTIYFNIKNNIDNNLLSVIDDNTYINYNLIFNFS